MEDSSNGFKTISDEPQGKDGSEEQTKDDGVMSQDNNPTTQVDLSENSSAISSNSQIKSNVPPDDVPIIESSSTEKSQKDVGQPVLPRATRSSQNPDFAAKHRKFISSKLKRDVDNDSSENLSATVKFVNKDSRKSQEILNENISGEKRKRNSFLSKSTEVNEEISDNEAIVKKKKSFKSDYQPTLVNGEQDSYCWRCHRDGNVIPCETCPRVYHLRCIQLEVAPSRGWVCPECSTVMHAENVDTRSRAMQMLTLDQLCKLLKFAVNRMKGYEGSEEFAKPVDTQQFEHYRNFIIKPMDLSLMEENIKNNLYGSTEAFLADAKWILHNCVIFNSAQSKFTNVARALLKICKQEMLEIENCPDCYQNAHTRSSDSWFIEVCRKPHILVWAKLKGFPFWPAKAMSTNSENQVDVRFFGAHDRAWVPVSACYLYSKMPPVQSSKKKNNLEDCIQELEAHIKKLQDKFGMFQHAPYKTPYNPEEDQLSILLPKFDGKCSPLKRVGRLVLDSISSSSINSISVPQTHNIKRDSNQVRKEKSVENKSNESKLKRRAKPMIRPTIKLKRESNSEKDDDDEASLVMCDESENKSKTLDDSNDLSPSESDMQQNNSNVLIPSSNQTKIAFVDKLQEKLSRLSDTNMDQVKQCQENKTVCEASSNETNCTNIDDLQESLDKNDTDNMKVKPVVVLHDLKNDKILNEHIKKAVEKLESGNQMVLDEHSEKIDDNLGNSSDVEEVLQVACSSPSQSVNSNNDVVECESVKKKKNNIDSVVESINRRKSSTEATESDKSMDAPDYTIVKANSSTIGKCNDKNTNKFDSKEPSSDENEVTSTRPDNEKIALDNDYPLAIIDESNEDNMSSSSSVREIPVNSEDSNKILKLCLETLDKPQVDKNRRKGKPAKVCSRSSMDSEENYEDIRRISTESYHNDSNNCSEDQDNFVVLDEVSGTFKNNHKYVVNEKLEKINEQASRTKSSDQESSNVTINVISDESDLNKKSSQEIRASINLSKDVSLSVLGDNMPSVLDMECVSDTEENVVLDQNTLNTKLNIRPTARKTFTKPQKPQSILSQKTNGKPVQQGKSKDLTDCIRIRSPQSLKNISPIILSPTNKTSTPVLVNSNNNNQPDCSPITMPGQNNHSSPPFAPFHKPNQKSVLAGSGPLNAHLNKVSQKLTGHFRMMLEDILKDMAAEGCTEAKVKSLILEMEKMQWRHRQEMAELKHNSDLILMEVRASMESEKQRILLEKEMAIQETKQKQWCAYCRKEALLYCCWNTAYCSYICQQAHWAHHMSVCAQNSGNDNPKQIRVTSGHAVSKPFNIQNQPQLHDDKIIEFEETNNTSYIDLDNEDGVSETITRIKPPRRKRCGECEGCSQLTNCQNCRSCLNERSHQVCLKRQCSNIIYNRPATKKVCMKL